MQILSPQNVKGTATKLVEEQGRILQGLAERVAHETHTLNDLTAKVEAKRRDIQKATESMDRQIREKHAEVRSLEERKQEAMKPVENLIKEWCQKIADLENQTKDLEKRRDEVSELREGYLIALEEIQNRNIQAWKAEEELDRRAEGVKREEERVKDETTRLTTALHLTSITTGKKEREFTLRENTLKAREHALTVLENSYREDRATWNEYRSSELKRLGEERKAVEKLQAKLKK
jgi:chromosome segregation ATPase